MKRIEEFVNDQLSRWPLACENFRALKRVQVKRLSVGGLDVSVQFNPARIISSAARTDAASLNARPCFLCPENRPPEQIHIRFDGRKGKKYDILVNPYPIFPDHLVIAFCGHSGQSIWRRYVDILDLARAYPEYIFFYNGPKCGASAPDHHHFQGAGRGRMPLENDVDALLDAVRGRHFGTGAAAGGAADGCGPLSYLASVQDADLFHYGKFVRGVFVLRSRTAKSAAKLFYRLIDCAPVPEGDSEPRFNLFTYFKDGEYRSIVVFRRCHRSHHYFSDGPDHLTMSPGCADMAGIFITPLEEDFGKLDDVLLSEMLDEVTLSHEEEAMIADRLTRRQQTVEVGIMSAREIVFSILSDGAGPRKAVLKEGKIEYDGALYDELDFGSVTPSSMFAEPTFVLYGVTIGKDFHWQKKEDQKFAGALKIIVEKNLLTAVNVVGVEDYLVSVISSEMKSTASLEFLKAHAVISRSWVMARIAGKGNAGTRQIPDQVDNLPSLVTWLDIRTAGGTLVQTPGDDAAGRGNVPDGGDGKEAEYGIMKWYGHASHGSYDVCADDHCQRYQGLTRAAGKNARDAVDSTWGEVLVHAGGHGGAEAGAVAEGREPEICDARFSKCCGGVTERFSTCWEDRDYDYLPALPDTPGHSVSGNRSFCDTADEKILSQVLNDYDLATRDFFRWDVKYGRQELSDIVRRRSGIDIGLIASLEPLERGGSGRIRKLGLTGSKGSLIVGKELEIRRILSESHLKSSAFQVEYLDAGGHPVELPENAADAVRSDWTEVVLHGCGWGHGVGLCQIGAAVMAAQGYTYRQILEHYYPGTDIRTTGK